MVFEVASKIANPFSLAAFAIAALFYITLRRRGKIPDNTLVAVVLLVLFPIGVGAIPIFLEGDVYRARVTVIGPRGTPVDDAKVWSSIGGEPKKVSGGWQFDIPEASIQEDRTVAFYASRESGFLFGKREVHLRDLNSAIAVKLERDESASVRGVVVDATGNAVSGARVSVAGYGKEAVATEENGSFTLPAHAAEGQQVLLRAEKEGYEAASQWHPAGDSPAQLLLRPEDK